MNIEKIYELFLRYPNITTDSRKVPSNSIFWALRGDNFNGNKFAEQALVSGAEYAIIDDKNYFISGKTILVEDSLKALQELANYHRKQLNIPIFALTGTNGKTTTKELIKVVLSTKYKVAATEGNLNNHIGVPLTLLSFDKNTEKGIIEMGANHIGEIKLLCEIAEPDFGLITNIGKAHLEGFGSFEGVIKAKSELYDNIVKNEGVIFCNSDNNILKKLDKGNKIIFYGTKPGNYVEGKLLSSLPCLKVEIKISDSVKIQINTNLTGKYNFENILAAACVGVFFNVSADDIKKAVENYYPENNRSQLIKKKHNTVILDAYNANPSSMRVSIESFSELENENKIIILGDMYELGKYSQAEHKKILNFAKEKVTKDKSIKEVLICGKYFGESYMSDYKDCNILYFSDTENVKEYLKSKTYENFIFLIKGSRAMKMENVADYIN